MSPQLEKRSTPVSDSSKTTFDELSISPRRLNTYYGVSISFYTETVSACALIHRDGEYPSAVPELTFKMSRDDRHSIVRVLDLIHEVFKRQLEENPNFGSSDYILPLLIALPDDQEAMRKLIEIYDLPNENPKLSEIPLPQAMSTLVAAAAKDVDFPFDRGKIYGGRFDKKSKSSRKKSEDLIDPRNVSFRGKVSLNGPKAADGDKDALRRLTRLARTQVRRELRNDEFAGAKGTWVKNQGPYFLQFSFPEAVYFNTPAIRDEVAKEFIRKGYRGKVVLSFPNSEKQPYFASVVSEIILNHIEKS